MPSGPLRQKKIVTKSPTTTGGRPIPVLIKLTTSERPGNRVMAIKIPSGIPTSRDSPVAVPETSSEKSVMPSTSASPLKTSRKACLIPYQTSSILSSDFFFALASDRNEERLAKFFHAESLDHGLSVGGDHKVSEGLSPNAVYSRPVRRINLHHRVDIQEWFVAFEKDRKRHPFAKREISSPVADRIAVAVVGDTQGCAHSLAGLDVPSSLGVDPRHFPQRLFQSVGARVISSGDKSASSRSD